MNPSDPAIAVAQWGVLQWLGSLLAPVATAAYAYLYRRTTANEVLIREIEEKLRESISEAEDKARAGDTELRRDIQALVQGIYARLDLMVTKDDLRQMFALAQGQK